MRLVDKYWIELFDKHNILDNINKDDFYEITAAEINEFREARLMTKFDNRSVLPEIFKKNKISILPTRRGSYVLGHFDNYEKLKYRDIKSTNFNLPSYIESIDYNNLYSESSSLACAYIGGVIDDIAGEETLPTIDGRMSSGVFDYKIKNIINNKTYELTTTNSQIEIDGGYESYNKLILVEAKNFSADDFLIRQLYYPYRLWSNKIEKEVIPVFFTYSNDVFSFFIYRFNNVEEYNSIELVEQRNYIIEPEKITLDNIFDVFKNVTIIQEPEIPFPQADSFVRIIDLLGILVDEKELTKEEITDNYAFTERQTSYYTTAGRYLGLIDKKRDDAVYYFLSDEGKRIMGLKYKQKYLSIVDKILSHEVFYKVAREYFNTSSPVSKNKIIEIMNECYLYNIDSQSTVERRASTVLNWIEWILDLID